MKTLYLRLTLCSDATFGRGDGVAGLVDMEVEHDDYGLPFLRGRSLKGLLVEECANILYALSGRNKNLDWHEMAQFLFGRPGSELKDDGQMFVSDARLPLELRKAIAYAIEKKETLTRQEVLESLTAIRRQTAMTTEGAPRKGSLRSLRVILRKSLFESELTFRSEPTEKTLALLSACVASLRRVGTGRNRGRGRVTALLSEQSSSDEQIAQQYTTQLLQAFAKEIG